MSHSHHHGHAHSLSAKALGWAFILNVFFTLVELVGGWLTGSVAVLSDSVHDLGDSLVLGAAWFLQRLATRTPDAKYSYGYGRYSMLGGWMASLVLMFGSLVMMAMSIPRLFSPAEPHTQGMIVLAVFGLLINGLAAYLLRGGKSLNETGVFLHLLEDVLGWAAVLIGAVVMHFTGWAIIDPMLAIGISLYILYNALHTLRKGTRIMMQGLPTGLEQHRVEEILHAIPGVIGTHDQHAWSLDGEFVVLTVHLVIDPNTEHSGEWIKEQARTALHELHVDHVTLELESPDEHCDTQHDHA